MFKVSSSMSELISALACLPMYNTPSFYTYYITDLLSMLNSIKPNIRWRAICCCKRVLIFSMQQNDQHVYQSNATIINTIVDWLKDKDASVQVSAVACI